MIPFLDLSLINRSYQAEIELASLKVLRSGSYIMGQELKAFEKEFANYCESSYAVGVGNGLDAITVILKAYDFPPDSEIIIPANTYIASVLPVSFLGLKPVLVEPDEITMLLDPRLVQKAITGKTKAIITVDLYGKSCDMTALNQLALDYDLKIITDAAQAHGAYYNGKKVGGIANATAFSFYPTKNLGAFGDAGAVTTNDADLAEKIECIRNYGSKVRYVNEYQGFNSRMDEIQAAILSVKLPFLDKENDRRRSIAERYLKEILLDDLSLPPSDSMFSDAWHLFVVRHPYRAQLASFLERRGIQCNVHYPTPIHLQKAYKELNNLKFPITEKIHQQVLSLPLNPTLSDDDINQIISAVNDFKPVE